MPAATAAPPLAPLTALRPPGIDRVAADAPSDFANIAVCAVVIAARPQPPTIPFETAACSTVGNKR